MKVVVVDTSAVVAIVIREAERDLFIRHIVDTDIVFISATNLLESRMVLYGRNQTMPARLDELIDDMRIHIEPVTLRQSDIAFDAFKRYGKGSGHKAALNFGDCFAYALAIERDAPLLFKRQDFIHTDVKVA